MKFNIQFKILVAFIACFAIFGMVFFYFLRSAETTIVVEAGNTVAKGVLISLDKALAKQPPSQWATIAKARTQGAIKIMPIASLQLNPQQIRKLQLGEAIFASGKTYQFLNLVIIEHRAYHRIGQSNFALVYLFFGPEQTVAHYLAPAFSIIIHDLKSKPQNTWPKQIRSLEKTYGFPIKVYHNKDQSLSDRVKKTLANNKIAFSTAKDSLRITNIYTTFSGGVIRIGPLEYLSFLGRSTDMLYYFIWAFFIVALCLIAVLSTLFVRNMKKIYQVTEHYSHGDFEYQTHISNTSVLAGLHNNIQHMGERLQHLMASHKQLCRFVAHETRTPLSTMQMALDNIKRTKTLDAEMTEQLASIEEDIDDLNNLISTFLIYSQLQAQDLKPHKVKFDIFPELKNLVHKYQMSNFKVELNADAHNSTVEIQADIQLFKHAINNLLTNAIKFAKNHIVVSVDQTENAINIHVDDDGPGLAADLRDDIFSEYVCRLDAKRHDQHIGIGLAIVKRVALLHDASVAASNSALLAGACFTITFPRSDPKP